MRSDAKPPTAGTNHRLKQSGALAIAALLAMAIVVATAFAGKDVVQTIGDGDGGSAPGTFSNNNGLDVNDPEVADASEDPYGNPTDGYIYVADEDAARVQVFDSEHNFVFVFGGDVNATAEANICPRPGFPEDDCDKAGDNITQEGGYFDDLQDVAIDQSDGSVYVMDEDNARVQKFSSDGEFLWTVGNNVNADELPAPDLCLAGDTCQAGTNDVAENGFTTNSVGHLAVDPNAPFDLYVADEDHSRIQVFNSEGEFQRMYGYGVQDGEAEPQVCEAGCQNGITDAGENILGQLDEPIDVDVDDAGRIYVLDDDNENVVRFEDGTTFAGPEVFAEADLSGSPKPGRIEISPGPEAAASDDAIYVTKEQEGETRVLELDEAGTVTDTHMQGAGIGISASAGGLAVNRPLGELYVSDDSPDYVYVLDDPLPPVALVMDPITVNDDTTATFTGTVDPEGGLVTSCGFEYSTDPGFNTEVKTANEAGCGSLEPGGGPQAVEEDVTGLIPNATYYVRLQAERPFVSGSEVTSETQTFDTDSVPPVVGEVGALQIQDTSARFAAEINPKNSATGYVFEYGTTPALGKVTAPLAIGSGNEPVVVSQVVSGLVKDSPYYMRVKATNAFGDTLSEQAEFHTRAEPSPLPANRAYEMVSPPDKLGGDVNRLAGAADSPDASPSLDGNRLVFCTASLFGEVPPQAGNSQCTGYLSRRSSHGWTTEGLYPPFCRYAADGTPGQNQVQLLSSALDRAVTAKFEPANCPIPPLDPAAPATPGEYDVNLYLQNLDGNVADPSSFKLMASERLADVPFLGSGNAVAATGASPDLNHVFFRSLNNQTPEPDSPSPGNFEKIYEWSAPGAGCSATDPHYRVELAACLRLASKDGGGIPFASDSFIPENTSAVSTDGGRVYFANDDGVKNSLHMREGGAVTHNVSESECTEECDPVDTDAVFLRATPDGSVSFFRSCDRLSDDAVAGCQLYRWSRALPPGSRLTSLGKNGRMIGTSDDGEIAFIFGKSISAGGDEEPIWRWQWAGGAPLAETIAQVENLGPSLEVLGSAQLLNTYPGVKRVTPSGDYFVLVLRNRLDPIADKDLDRDLYRWGEDDGFLCVSCQPPGAPSLGHANWGVSDYMLGSFTFNNRTVAATEAPSIMSDDGERIYFDTPDPLVPADVNGEVDCPQLETFRPRPFLAACSDVYEWHDGRIGLISSGTSSDVSNLIGSDATGENVFFFTRQRLVGWDRDENVDIYSARIGGGFPEPAAQPPGCEGEACRGEGTDEPSIVGAGSAVFQGAGNPKTEPRGKRCPAKRLRRGKRCLTVLALARKRCRRLSGPAKRRCVRRQARRLRRAQRRRAQRRAGRGRSAHNDRRVAR